MPKWRLDTSVWTAALSLLAAFGLAVAAAAARKRSGSQARARLLGAWSLPACAVVLLAFDFWVIGSDVDNLQYGLRAERLLFAVLLVVGSVMFAAVVTYRVRRGSPDS